MLKGKRTYISLALVVCTVAASVLPGQKVLTPDITAALVALFTALAAYFRSQA